jgi:hypothetical protein
MYDMDMILADMDTHGLAVRAMSPPAFTFALDAPLHRQLTDITGARASNYIDPARAPQGVLPGPTAGGNHHEGSVRRSQH